MAAGLRPEAVQSNVSEGDLEQDAAEQQHGVECDGLGQAIREPLLLEHQTIRCLSMPSTDNI